jgi:hypothetical protein
MHIIHMHIIHMHSLIIVKFPGLLYPRPTTVTTSINIHVHRYEYVPDYPSKIHSAIGAIVTIP